ncbi:MAG: DEAD/DEAH box helicase, partial [Candidatus Methanomethylophilaceae archaeon]
MPFPQLSPELVAALASRGITEPTPPQADSIPRILKGENLLLVAPTGIGKTEAAMLPILDTIFRTKGKTSGIRCIYITPLRALNRDMLKRMEEYGRMLNVTVGVRHGDTSQAERNRQSQNPPELLITTPETLQVLFTGKRLVQHLKNVEWVVVDEIHELANTERGAQMSVALERLTLIAGNYQRIGLSATVGNVENVARFLVGNNRDVVIRKHDTHRDFDISVESPEPDTEDKKLLDKLQSDPDILAVMKRAREIIEGGRSTLFFVNTRETAEWLAARYHLWDEDISIEVHHGSLSKENRMEMEDLFKRGEVKALICTSSLELGIDVGSTDMVIQYNSPRQVSRMIQRAGRAGHRIGEKIRAKVIATAPDEVAEAMVIARRCDAKELEYWEGRPSPLSVVANQLIAMTMGGAMDRDSAFKVFKRSYVFR